MEDDSTGDIVLRQKGFRVWLTRQGLRLLSLDRNDVGTVGIDEGQIFMDRGLGLLFWTLFYTLLVYGLSIDISYIGSFFFFDLYESL